jgi:PHD/YefM family antitoxin component YafN of YafNO toxin-antitoxin module
MKVTCSEFRANFGRYIDLSLTEPVILTNFSEHIGVMISAEIFRNVHSASEPVITVTISDFQKNYAHYQKLALTNTIIITTRTREKTALLSPTAFDNLFHGVPKPGYSDFNIPIRIQSTEFHQNTGRYLTEAIDIPIIITKHARDKNVLLSATLFSELCAKAEKSRKPQGKPLRVAATQFAFNYGYYQDISITTPVIIMHHEIDQNALISAESFNRLLGHPENYNRITFRPPRELKPEEVRDLYTYKDLLHGK